MPDAKPYCISRKFVMRAWQLVKANRGAAGADGESLSMFEKDLKGNLYEIWNRMSSGSYFPPPVRLVEIPKGNGKMRPLGIPTVSDRIAQMVTRMVLEPLVEQVPSGFLWLSSRQVGIGRSRQSTKAMPGHELGH